MSNVTPNFIRGFLVPFAEFSINNLWHAQTVASQGQGYAGVPAPQQSSSLVLQSRGSLNSGVDIATHSAGHIGLNNASFLWKNQTDAKYYGSEVPNKLCGIQNITGFPAAASKSIPRSTIKSADGTILVCVEYTTIVTNGIKIYRIDVSGNLTSQTIDSVLNTTLGGSYRYPTLTLLPDGSIICIAWSIDDPKEQGFLRSWRTADDGVTWTLQSSNMMPLGEFVDLSGVAGAGNSGYQLGRITAASDSHSVLIIAEVIANDTSQIRNQYYQLISYSAGTKVTIVASPVYNGSSQFFHPTMIEYNGTFVISYGKTADNVGVVSLTDPTVSIADTISLSTVTVLDMPNFNVVAQEATDGGRTMYIDGAGRIHLYCLHNNRDYLSYGYCDIAGIAAADYGKNWNYMRQSTTLRNSRVLEETTPAGDAKTIKEITGVSSQGSQFIFCNGMPNAGNPYENSMTRYEFGQWRTIQYPQLVSAFPSDVDSGYNIHEYIPTALPTDSAMWIKTTAGVTSETLKGGGIDVTSNATGLITYEMSPTNKTNGFLVHSQVSVTAEGSTVHSSGIQIKVQAKTSTQTYFSKIVLTQGGIFVYDLYSATPFVPIASDNTLGAWGGAYILLVWLDNSSGYIRVLYYQAESSPVAWKELTGNLTLNADTTQHIKWGILNPTILGLVSQASSWGFVSIGEGAANGKGMTGIDPINGKLYSPNGFWTDIKDGLKLSTLDGAARESETWKIDPDYSNGISNMLYDVSPTRSWAWVSDAVSSPDSTNTAQEILSWHVDSTIGAAANSVTTSTAIGLHLSGINFRSYNVETYNASSSTWTTVATVDNSVAQGFNFVRVGSSIFSIDANGDYIEFAEAIGWKLQLDDGAGNVVVRGIKYNGDGVLNAFGSKQAIFLLNDIVNATDPTTGTAHLIPDSCTVIFQANVFSSVRITIPAQRTQEGYFKIGIMMLGELVVPAQQYSRGRSITFSSDTDIEEGQNGVLRARKRGIGGRAIRIAWTEGVETSPLNNSPATPDFYKLQTTGNSVAVLGSAPSLMMGLCKYLSGGLTPLVYLPSLEKNTGAILVMNRKSEHALCTMGNEVEIQNVLGSELQGTGDEWGELLRVGSITLREVR
jgi:hypothetical protein